MLPDKLGDAKCGSDPTEIWPTVAPDAALSATTDPDPSVVYTVPDATTGGPVRSDAACHAIVIALPETETARMPSVHGR